MTDNNSATWSETANKQQDISNLVCYFLLLKIKMPILTLKIFLLFR